MDINIIFLDFETFKQEMYSFNEFEVFVCYKSLIYLTKEPIGEFVKDGVVILSEEFVRDNQDSFKQKQSFLDNFVQEKFLSKKETIKEWLFGFQTIIKNTNATNFQKILYNLSVC